MRPPEGSDVIIDAPLRSAPALAPPPALPPSGEAGKAACPSCGSAGGCPCPDKAGKAEGAAHSAGDGHGHGVIEDTVSLGADSHLSEDERQAVEALKARDREVREHERAHAAAGAGLAGAPSFSFETGPDGRQYAVGGEVSIDASPVPGDPQATIAKMEQVKRAALAPAQPSAQDRAVAAQADAQIAAAHAEARELEEENAGNDKLRPASPEELAAPPDAEQATEKTDAGANEAAGAAVLGRAAQAYESTAFKPAAGLLELVA